MEKEDNKVIHSLGLLPETLKFLHQEAFEKTMKKGKRISAGDIIRYALVKTFPGIKEKLPDILSEKK